MKSADRAPSKIHNEKKKSLFDNDDDLFGSKDAPEVDLFAAASIKNSSAVSDQLFDKKQKPVRDSYLFDKDSTKFAKSKNNTASSLFHDISNSEKVPKYPVNSLFSESLEDVNNLKASGDNLFETDLEESSDNLFEKDFKISGDNNLFEKNPKRTDFHDFENVTEKQSVNNLFREPQKVQNVSETKNSKTLFKDSESFLDSDLFTSIPKQKQIVSDKSSHFISNSKNIFGDDLDSDLFGSSSKNVLEQNIVKHSSENLFDDLKRSTNLFGNNDTKTPKENIKNIKNSPENIFEDKSKILKTKKLTTSIFDDSDEEDQDLFSGFSFLKKTDRKNMSSVIEEKKNINTNVNVEECKIKEEDDLSTKKMKEKDSKSESKGNKEGGCTSQELKTKSFEKIKLFDDNDDEDNDDDLFGVKKKSSVKESENKSESEVTKFKEPEVKQEIEIKLKTDASQQSVLDATAKKAMFAEIKQKLEKHKLEQSETNTKSESSAVDGSVGSKKEPPKTLKIQETPPASDESSANQQGTKKPAMSGKIKNLMGKMNDLKILSPTDTPPLLRKKHDEKSNNDNEQKAATDLGSSEASSPSLPSSESSPRASG
jgi:hypothetical protein